MAWGKKRKYVKGKAIKNIETLLGHLNKKRWVFWRDRPMHPILLENMTLATLRRAVKRKIIYRACPNT
ncbi:MAG: hypothetical protein JRC93_12395 [Deltaproteobacteria bacterium]|nr:hypothetical protein [Deltaproteobacteria bacterium]